MAYKSEDMRLMGGVPGQQMFIYTTDDDILTVVADNYFDMAAEDYNLDTGDIIIACTGATQADAVDMMVATNTAGSVTVINGT